MAKFVKVKYLDGDAGIINTDRIDSVYEDGGTVTIEVIDTGTSIQVQNTLKQIIRQINTGECDE